MPRIYSNKYTLYPNLNSIEILLSWHFDGSRELYGLQRQVFGKLEWRTLLNWKWYECCSSFPPNAMVYIGFWNMFHTVWSQGSASSTWATHGDHKPAMGPSACQRLEWQRWTGSHNFSWHGASRGTTGVAAYRFGAVYIFMHFLLCWVHRCGRSWDFSLSGNAGMPRLGCWMAVKRCESNRTSLWYSDMYAANAEPLPSPPLIAGCHLV